MMQRVGDRWDERPDLIFAALAVAADNAGISICVSYAEPDRVNLVYWNHGTETLVGYSDSELRGRSVWSFFPQEELPRLRAMHEARVRGEQTPPVFETEVIHSDGRRIPVEFSTARVMLGERPANVTFLFDITHRKLALQALRRSDERFRTLIEAAPDGITILRWPTIVFINPSAAYMLGFRTAEAAIGKDMLTLLTPLDAARSRRRAERLSRGQRLEDTRQYTTRDPDGNELTLEVSAIPIEYENAPAVLAFARNVTERKNMLAQLMEADKLAAVGTLAAGVAHEINNPLAYLLLNLEFLIREIPKTVSDPVRSAMLLSRLRETKQGAERVKTIVRDLQTFTRRDDGIRGPVDLPVVIDAALHLARHELQYCARVVKNFQPIPPVHGNTTRFEQLFLNLLINAAQALEGRALERNVIEIELRQGPGAYVTAVVRDNGVGIPRELLRRIFDPFFTTKATGVGTGLGLSICQGIVRAVEGEITVDSELGIGTTMKVLLPIHVEEEEPIAPATPIPPGHARVPRARVLVVDDERAVAESLALALGEDYEVVTLPDAASARARIGSGEHFDLVLCDLVMPGETGMQLFEQIERAQPALADRFAFMTGGAFLPEAERFLSRISNPRIEKPFDVDALRALVDRMVSA